MTTNTLPVSEAEILAAVIAPKDATWPGEFCRMILGLRFTADQAARMTTLAERNNAEGLPEIEQTELANYVRVSNFLSLAHSKARRSLKQRGDKP